MRLKLTLIRPGGVPSDLTVTVEPNATVGEIATAVSRRAPAGFAVPGPALSLRIHADRGHHVPPPDITVSQVGLRSGTLISLAAAPEQYRDGGSARPTVATVRILEGPDAGKEFPLPAGSWYLGRSRSCDVRLSDPLISKEHARINVGQVAEIVDTNSSNGILVGGGSVQRAVLGADDQAVLGDTTIAVTMHGGAVAADEASSPVIEFNRSPRLTAHYEGATVPAPEPPQPPAPGRLPVLTLLAPIALGIVLYLVTRSVLSILFVAASPVLMLGTYFENRVSGKRAHRKAATKFRSVLADFDAERQQEAEVEQRTRQAEHPAVAEIVDACTRLTTLCWSRRPEHKEFLQLRLGLGRRPSRSTIDIAPGRGGEEVLLREARAVAERFATVDQVPVIADLRVCGGLGLGGLDHVSMGIARGLVVQLIGLHSPAELVLSAMAPSSVADRWDWLKWLPHTSSPHSPLPGDHLATGAGGCVELTGAIEELIAERSSAQRPSSESPPLPAVVLLVEDNAPVARSRLVEIAESGAACGVYVLWCAASVERLPAACRSFIRLDPNSAQASAGNVPERELILPLSVEIVSAADAEAIARRLSGVVDAGVAVSDESDLPVSVSTLLLAGTELAESSDAVVERWTETLSISSLVDPAARGRRVERTLRALVGQASTDPMYLDLRSQGPHALVGGTTGAGKSEFLQTWILGMATAYSPDRVTFLFVDYKGGSAFADCVQLPHSVGMVTDLNQHLVRRALTSLNAELRFRERILERKRVKDLDELEREGGRDCPPRLIIVVDEFAALVSEVPEFVDGVVNVAQRGRSLGLHLILATQRPAGVIKDNLRANTNLRVALRMADEADSTDVLGSAQAASFDPSIPGRAIAKTGHGRLSLFQSGYVGGWTSTEPEPTAILIDELAFGHGARWEEPEADRPQRQDARGPNDIQRIVSTVQAAAALAAVPTPRRPWLPELAGIYDLAMLPNRRTDAAIVIGVCDDAEQQAQPVISFVPDRDGNMVVYGTGGAGKSAFLRTVGASTALTARGGPCHVYALDFAGGALRMLEDLPHVGGVITGDDQERVVRLLRWLRAVVDERAARYAAIRAGTISEYRELSGNPLEPRIVLLVDGLTGFRQEYEFSRQARWFQTFTQITADGRQVGVHVIVAADRPGSVPASLGSAIQQRLVLRLADDNDYALVSAPSDAFAATTPAGRGFLDGREVQVAILGGDANVAAQARAIGKLARTMSETGVAAAAPVRRLPTQIRLSELPVELNGAPVFGVSDDDLLPVAFVPTGCFVIAGPPSSGRTTMVATLVAGVQRWRPEYRLVYVGNRRSPLLGVAPWSITAVSHDEIVVAAGKLTEELRSDDGGTPTVIVVESVADFLNTPADGPLVGLVQAARAGGHCVIADGEAASMTSSWPLLQAARADRKGFALQPDQTEGLSLFQTPFGAMTRAEFPPGRGLFVLNGRTARVQVAMPE